MRNRLTFRLRSTLWVALLTTTAGLVVLTFTVVLTARLVHDRARPAGPAPAAPTVPLGPPPLGAPPPAPPATQVVSQSDQRRALESTLDDVRRYALFALGGLVAVSVSASWFVTGQMLRPLRSVTDTARSISGAGDGRRLTVGGPEDELKDLAQTFNAMLDRVDASFDEQRAFTANASHELRTPLAIMRAEADVALESQSSQEYVEALRAIRSQTDRMNNLVERMLHLSRAGTLVTVEDHDLAVSARRAVDQVTALGQPLPSATLALGVAPVRGDGVLLDQLATNVVANAFAYRTQGGHIQVSTAVAGSWSELIVENDGPIIDPAEVEHLFDRFRRRGGEHRQGGFGLGLTIVATIARTHGGTVTATARGGGGLRVVVRIPRP